MALKYGIIGCGAWGTCYAEAIRKNPDLELSAVAEVDADTLENIRDKYPDVIATADYGTLLDRDIDVVALVTPNHLHHSIGMDVLRAGKHLLIEKPFALTVGECDDMILLADKQKLKLVVGHQFRLSSLWGRIKEMVDAGFVGKPLYSLVELSRNPYRSGVDGWRFDPRRVGNWISEEPIHFLDLACWYFQKYSEPVSLHASVNASNVAQPELQDNIGAMIEFSDGSFAVVAQTLCAFEHHQTVKITGTEGAIWAGWSGALDRTLHPEFFLKTFDGKNVDTVRIEKTTGELYELEDQLRLMADIVRDRAPIPCTGRDGRLAVKLSLAAIESAQRKQSVKLQSTS